MKHGISWVLLATEKYNESLTFYRDTLGFTVEREVKEDQFCQFKLPNCNFAIFGRSQLENLLGAGHIGTPGGAIYSFPDSSDIDKDFEMLRAKGVKFLKAPTTQPWGQRTAYFTDPDGHIWELQQWLKN